MQYDIAMADIYNRIEQFTKRGSGWVIGKIAFVDIYISKYSPIRGRTHCQLPPELASRKAIINVKNRDDKCFMWSVLAALHPVEEHAERISKYKMYQDQLDFTGLEFPMALSNIPTFERMNELAINVLGYGDNGLFPLYSSKIRDKRVVNLLLLTPEENTGHYCLIKNLDKLLFSSTGYEHKKFICNCCLCPFNNQERLDRHQEFCTVDKQRVEMPKDAILKFRNVHRQVRYFRM